MNKKLNNLTAAEENILIQKGTEAPFTGEYNEFSETGIFVCKHCDLPLYRSSDKFDSGCGWPSFDDEIENHVLRQQDADGRRTEILCAQCGGHLGHVFEGEQITAKNTRHCVNSLSMKFIPQEKASSYDIPTETAYYAGGCFWGVEHLLQQRLGVLSVVSGYMGGTVDNPSYEQVCSKTTGHLEVVAVTFNPQHIDYESLTKLFFEIHDPSQTDGQGPDLGPQYASAIFYATEEQKSIAQKLIAILQEKGISVATTVRPVETFWRAEEYHQDYYGKSGKTPYCHSYCKRF